MKYYPNRSLIFILLFSIGLSSGCSYGEVSPKTYDYALALFSISNRKDVDRLEEFASQVTADAESGDLPEDEAELLMAIVAQARAGDWASANAETRRMMEDQIEE